MAAVIIALEQLDDRRSPRQRAQFNFPLNQNISIEFSNLFVEFDDFYI